MRPVGWMTTGQLARRTGMTVRTLRYYDQIGLLTPSGRSDGDARMYGGEDLIRLQRIQTLKYIGLSLPEIREILDGEAPAGQEAAGPLAAQLEVLYRKKAHTEQVIRAIRHAMGKGSGVGAEEAGWDGLADIIRAVRVDGDWAEQYRTAARLRTRTHLYDRFGTNPIGWHRWVFDRLTELAGDTARVLELGGGDGALWLRNADRLPPGWRVTLTDLSEGMVEEAKRRLTPMADRVKVLTADAQDIPFHDGEFDVVIANNMLYHVPDIPKALGEMHRVMQPGGLVCLSTMSLGHLKEMEELAAAFDPGLKVLDRTVERFHLGNGETLLAPWFKDLRMDMYEDRLVADEWEPLAQYMLSTATNAGERLAGEERERFFAYIRRVLEENGMLEMTKENGIWTGRKRR